MKRMQLICSAIITFSLVTTGLKAQEALTAAGGNSSGSGGSVSYSVGQFVYTKITGTTGSVAQGVLQPYEISVISGIDANKRIDLQCKVYPNPVSHSVCLTMEETQFSGYFYWLYDNTGKFIEQQKITGSATDIDMTALAPTFYYLIITKNNRKQKTFRITKN